MDLSHMRCSATEQGVNTVPRHPRGTPPQTRLLVLALFGALLLLVMVMLLAQSKLP
jgi:hypothetical protein